MNGMCGRIYGNSQECVSKLLMKKKNCEEVVFSDLQYSLACH